MNISVTKIRSSLAALLLATVFAPLTAMADSGFYIGGSYGNAAVDVDLGGIPGLPSEFDEDDNAYKVFLGYRFDLPSVVLAVEGGYVDFGQPEIDVVGDPLTIDTTGINLWGIAALEAGPVDFFAKLGYVSWDAEFEFQDQSASEDGTDLGYGVGLAFDVGPLQLRAEYELYDVEDADVSMVSLGFSFLFD